MTAQLERLPLLDLDTLRTLVAIADTGNFSAAAAVVFRTPSAVSMQVKKVEETVGRALFHRDSRSVTVTVDGEKLVRHGRRMLALNQDVMMQFIAPEVTGTVRLGAPDDVAERLLPSMLRSFVSAYCGITLDVVVDNSSKLEAAVKDESLDLAMITCDPSVRQPKNVEVMFRESLTWAGARNGIAFEKNPLPISVWEEGCSWRNAGLKSLKRSKRDYRVSFMSAHISGQRAAMLADLAVAPIPISSCTGGIVALNESHGLPSLGECGLGLIVSKNPSKPVQVAAEHLRSGFAALG